MSKELLTIIIPVYNVENYVEECLKTAIIDDEKIKYLIINDGSSDNSLNIIKKQIKNRKNVLLINQENKGLSEARNEGLKYVRSKWVTFIDSDDFLDPFRIEQLITFLEEDGNYDLYSLPVMLFDNGEKKVLQNSSNKYKLNKYIYYLMNGELQIGVWSYIFKTEIINKNHIRFDKDRLFEDKFFLPKYISNISEVQSVPANKIGYYYYRMRPMSITHKKINAKRVKDWYDSGKYITHSLSKFNNLDRETILAINEYENTILFRTYIDLLKINKKKEALFVKEEIKRLIVQDQLKFSLIIFCKIIITYMPTSIIMYFLNGGK